MGILERATAWWTRDTALHCYVFCSFLIGIPFTIFNTYVVYQIQVVGYIVGTDNDGKPCTSYCIVPWGNTQLDLNSVILYLNALAFGLGGFAALLLCAYSDFWSKKHLLVTVFIVCYGAFSIPAYWLKGYDTRVFASLIALYIIFNIFTLLLTAVLQIYIPYCMRHNHSEEKVLKHTRESQKECVPLPTYLPLLDEIRPADLTSLSRDVATSAQRRYAFNISVFGSVAVASGGVLTLVVTIILTQTLSGTSAQNAGLLVTTVTGFITVVGSVVAYLGLPKLPSKSITELKGQWTKPFVEFFTPIKDLVTRKSLGALLVAYTIYVDSTFAIASVASQLFVAEVHPDALEYSLYSLAQNLFQLFLPVIFLWLRPKLPLRLETWMVLGYSINLIVPIWGCIGLADVNFGFKRRWEFYAQLAVSNIAGTIVNSTFRVLFSEMLPPGAEVQWFSMQVVLSCATVWVNYVASGPLQNTTHQLRFPLVLSIVFLVCSLLMELCRVTLPVFIKDRQHWFEKNRTHNEGDVDKTQVVVKHN